MTFPVVATTNTSTEAVDTTTHTVNLPASIASGDLLLVFCAHDSATTATFPGGWTNLSGVTAAAMRIEIFYRQADGTEGATIAYTTPVADQTAHNSYRITGAEPVATQPPEAHATAVSGTSTSPDPPSLSPTGGAKDYLWIAFTGADAELVTAAPASYTNLITAGSGTTIGASTCRRELNAASEDPGVMPIANADDWIATTVAVHPSSGGAAAVVLDPMGMMGFFGA